MIKRLKKIDNWLLPETGKFRYAPYVWLAYLSIFFTSLVASNPSSTKLIHSAIGLIVFLFFYFHGYRANAKTVRVDIAGILATGTFLATITLGASVFFVYAGAFCCRLGSAKKAFVGLGVVLTWIFLASWYFEFSVYFYVPAALFSILIGGVNIYEFEIAKKQTELLLTQQEVKSLAKTAERERIARDLHDLIGHTFSVITLKAELASKLLDKRPAQARKEIAELEQISRDALQQVREVVSGYRTSDLTTELAYTKYILESNDIAFQYHLEELEMPEVINKELAIILKEFVTNIIKHANAEKASASIYSQNGKVIFDFSDDGVGIKGSTKNGFGLKGVGERVDKLGGVLKLHASTEMEGTSFTIEVPIEQAPQSNNFMEAISD